MSFGALLMNVIFIVGIVMITIAFTRAYSNNGGGSTPVPPPTPGPPPVPPPTPSPPPVPPPSPGPFAPVGGTEDPIPNNRLNNRRNTVNSNSFSDIHGNSYHQVGSKHPYTNSGDQIMFDLINGDLRCLPHPDRQQRIHCSNNLMLDINITAKN